MKPDREFLIVFLPMCSNIKDALVSSHIPSSDGSIMPSWDKSSIALWLWVQEHRLEMESVWPTMALICLLLLRSKNLTDCLQFQWWLLLIVIYKEFIGLLENQGFAVIYFELHYLLLLGGVDIEDGKDWFLIGYCELVLLCENQEQLVAL